MKDREPVKEGEVLDTEQAAEYLGVSPELLRADQHTRTPIPFPREGSRILCDPVVLDLFSDVLGR